MPGRETGENHYGGLLPSFARKLSHSTIKTRLAGTKILNFVGVDGVSEKRVGYPVYRELA
ncbi:hypothetical protein AKJ57_03110 [candidate division MSBL1 archaeon SCGC-AAA259A05]|uniref:Uncharacterized protein n=1 Tax=candidate division MSBL1 archaeon SCGC-AAA259A05 TaxID=1698259 RepID=A0A133U9S9_9EURY|nr:hypothetical protein AKJ57_03110 [candidate division MSBL1 archaeon SCGC-AAA259A05]